MTQLFLQTLLLGILQGGLYALLAIGLSLVFGILRVVNFAHGEFAMLGSFAAVFAAGVLGFPVWVGLIAAAAAGAAIALLTNLIVLRPIYLSRMQQKGEYTIIATFMLSQFLIAAATLAFGTTYRKLPGLWDQNLALFDMVYLSGNRIVAFVGALLLIGLLFLVVYRTDTGRAWRALTQNPLGATVVGIDVGRYANYAFLVSGAFAGVAAALLAPLMFVFPASGVMALVKAFIVVIIGGMGSIGGTLVAGLLLGVVEVLCTVLCRYRLHRCLRLRAHDRRAAVPPGRPVRTGSARSMTAVLEAVGLRKAFGGNHVVNGVDFRLEPGELVAIVGPNGAGKTSFLNLLSGQFRPMAGLIRLHGADVTNLAPNAPTRRKMFRSFQNGGAFGQLTARENVAVAGMVRGMGRAAAERAAEDALKRVGLSPVSEWPAEQLSGGQRKLIDFARLLLAQPRVALLDEPTAGVNPAIMDVMGRIIAEMRDAGTAFAVISHDLPWVFGLCRRVVVLAAGRVLTAGDPDTVSADPAVREAYLA
jgi:ABC-type branched-subunit amino acid transport system ATPase component/branched-subunit amino acid ABC-type transport system permease component